MTESLTANGYGGMTIRWFLYLTCRWSFTPPENGRLEKKKTSLKAVH